MATPTAARKSARTRRPAPVVAHPAAPSGRFAALLADVHIPDPYEITQNLVVDPPSRKQMRDIMACQAAFAIAQGQLSQLLAPELVPKLNAEGLPVLDDEEKPVMVEQLPIVDPSHIARINEVVEQSAERYNRALFGRVHEQVMDYFEDRPAPEWNAFYQDIQNEFMPLPESGQCPTCGHTTDEEQAGKPLASMPS